jgi:hypothetical protein
MTDRLKQRLLALRTDLVAEHEAAQHAIKDDGIGELIATQKEFSEWLAKNHGKDRWSEKAQRFIDSLQQREIRAKAKAAKYDPIGVIDKAMEAEFLLRDFDQEFWRLKDGGQ